MYRLKVSASVSFCPRNIFTLVFCLFYYKISLNIAGSGLPGSGKNRIFVLKR